MTQLVNGRARPTPLTRAGVSRAKRAQGPQPQARPRTGAARDRIQALLLLANPLRRRRDHAGGAERTDWDGTGDRHGRTRYDGAPGPGEAYPQPRGPAEDPRVPHAEGTAVAPAAARRGRERDASRARGDLAARIRASS